MGYDPSWEASSTETLEEPNYLELEILYPKQALSALIFGKILMSTINVPEALQKHRQTRALIVEIPSSLQPTL